MIYSTLVPDLELCALTFAMNMVSIYLRLLPMQCIIYFIS